MRFWQSIPYASFKRPKPKHSCVWNHSQSQSFICKALSVFAEELGCDNFQASDGCLDKWTKDTMFRLKQYQIFL